MQKYSLKKVKFTMSGTQSKIVRHTKQQGGMTHNMGERTDLQMTQTLELLDEEIKSVILAIIPMSKKTGKHEHVKEI